MTFVIKKVSDHGTTNPIVARIAIQTHEIVGFFRIDKKDKDELLEAYVKRVTPKLLACEESAKAIGSETEDILTKIRSEELTVQSSGRVIELPQVAKLRERSETFLYKAKSSLRDVAFIFGPLFNERFTHSRYNEIRSWADKRFGGEAPITKVLSDAEPWIERIVDMRNVVEHPTNALGPLHVKNFDLLNTNDRGQSFFQEPVWYLKGKKPLGISNDMHAITENILMFAEDLLVTSYIQLYPDPIVQFAEILENDRNPECPVRLRAVLNESRLKPKNSM